jgi:hypothetical protein
MSDLRKLLDIIENVQTEPEAGDVFELELGDTLIETVISEVTEDGVVIHLDETAMRIMIDAKKQLNEWMKMGADSDASAGGSYKLGEGMTKQAMHDDAEKMSLEQFCDRYGDEDWVKEFWRNLNDTDESMDEAKYQGREVPLGKPMAGDVKKSKVYVKGPKGNVVKVNFGDKNMRIKKSNPGRRKNFRARHNCDNPGPRWKARYWSCRAW